MNYTDPSGHAAEIGGDFGGGWTPAQRKQYEQKEKQKKLVTPVVNMAKAAASVCAQTNKTNQANRTNQTNRAEQAKQQSGFFESFFKPQDIQISCGKESRDSESWWDKLVNAGEAAGDFVKATYLTTKPHIGAWLLDRGEDLLSLIPGYERSESSHVQQAEQKRVKDLLEAYENASNKEAFENGVRFGDFRNEFALKSSIYIAELGVMGFGAALSMAGVYGNPAGIGGSDALAIFRELNAGAVIGGSAIVVGDGIIIANTPEVTTNSYLDILQSTGKNTGGEVGSEIPDYQKENRVPLDKETVLGGSDYQKTGKRVKGAQVYKKGDQYYYRDTFHTGETAHLEVAARKTYASGGLLIKKRRRCF